MLAPLVLALALQTPQAPVGRYELSERLKAADVAWMANKDAARRKVAVEHLNEATASFFRMQLPAAAKQLDLAIAALEGRKPRASDAVGIRLESPFVEPGQSARIRVSWVYPPDPAGAVVIGAGSKTLRLRPGQSGLLEVNPYALNPDLKLTPEIGYLMPVRVGPAVRHLYVSLVKNAPERVRALRGAQQPAARAMADLLQAVLESPAAQEVELPLIQYLFTAEGLHEGRLKLQDVEQVFLTKHGSTLLRAAFPKNLGASTEPVDVVIGLHGMGGSENMFFESYGRGMAVAEALKRDWVFVAPRANRTAVQDTLDWLTGPRGLKIRNLFIMGHSMGGGLAISSTEVKPAPTALALFAPASATAPQSVFKMPLYISVGKQDVPRLYSTASSIAREIGSRPDFKYEEFDPGDHIMVVPESIPGAYALFDKVKKK